MRISRRPASANREAEFNREIRQVLTAPVREGRVCGEDCTIICEACGSSACQCMCRCDCPDAPVHLSSDPDHFPIEAGIVPLVYAMKQEGACTPCWSCEGHNSSGGSLWKIPRVWFYCSLMVHLRLIGGGIHSLFHDRKIRVPWKVVITHSDPSNIDTTFSLEPTLSPDTDVVLSDLQADILVIAQAWPDFLKGEARTLSRSTRGNQDR